MHGEVISNLSPWEIVNIARDKNRPNARYYIEEIFDDFVEFHGDRYYKDDSAIVGGIASINGTNVTVIGINKGKTTAENIKTNFGMPHPEGYRKALRLMKQAEKFKRPVICFVDTPGAFCGVEAEERGQGEAIAKNILEMSRLKTPIISIIIGEGGSGGALALSVANKVYMLENSIYSVLSPEGFASILWKDASRHKEACEVMKITSYDLMEFGIIDDIINEPTGGAHKNPEEVATNIKEKLTQDIKSFVSANQNDIVNERYMKFRELGNFY